MDLESELVPKVSCKICNGKGFIDYCLVPDEREIEVCEDCEGSGLVVEEEYRESERRRKRVF